MAAFPGPPSPWSLPPAPLNGAWPARRAGDDASPPGPPPLPPIRAPSNLALRRLAPADRPSLEAQHAALFPVDYEPAFYEAVTTGTDGVFGYGLFDESAGGGDASLIAFVAARGVPWWELSPADVAALGLAPPPGAVARDGTPHSQQGGGPAAGPSSSAVAVVYVLTLGVGSPHHRRAGAGRALMGAVAATAGAWGAGAVYLHVAAFNAAALSFYGSLGRRKEGEGSGEAGGGGGGDAPTPSTTDQPAYRHARTLPSFYSIPKRPPVPGVTRYDAHLLVARLEAAEGVGEAAAARPHHHHPPPAWSRRSPLASPPLLPAEAVGGAGSGGGDSGDQPAGSTPAALLARWARAVWAALPAPPAWARRLFSSSSGGDGGGGGGGAAEGRQQQRAKAGPAARLPPVVAGDII
jgi:ribosomal protein S18 acetylase RimI-like enzyme